MYASGHSLGTSQKAPSTVSYNDNDVKWGYQTPFLGDVARAVKILLDEGQGRSYALAFESKRLIQRLEKDTVEVVGDYLGKLVSHATEIIDRRFGKTLDCMDVEWVLTVPAVWSDGAKNSTLRAGIAANIPANSITLVSEPEAAALHCLNSL